ncbi:NAD-dependent epimerase/dehydratase family protein [Shewanella sedimentimangrovi]|uniref:NAD-dependent epimerase/dehydratase family protein n=1 Tax=Shewanella sedimentimangrovi TaxID=2814293 RepID=A0ABX7QYK9_9GAMM|nr:NAD-dependent epimerase/dehydratase family protein [Shewanella sedimentimangrovi]QSX36026.1 NAD-dependent epimerase/dehydratase family protein [Shewanella sedimentimangrovi]
MKVLLTGASGFIGQHVSSPEIKFRRVIRGQKNKFHRDDFFYIDKLDNLTSWDGAFTNIDAIIHLAGVAHSKTTNLQDYQSINVDGTLHLANEAAKAGVKRFIFVSSIGVNGTFTRGSPFLSTSKPSPHNEYTQSKYLAELGLEKIASKTKMELVVIRPTLVYGPQAPGSFGMLSRLVSQIRVLPFSLVENRRDFISVQNLVDLLITCVKHPNAAGHIFLASEGETVSIKQFTNAIAKGKGHKLIQLPLFIWLIRLIGTVVGKSKMVEQLIGDLEVDSSNLKDILDWTPPYTMEESMAFLKDD